jgi:hypothetical protein
MYSLLLLLTASFAPEQSSTGSASLRSFCIDPTEVVLAAPLDLHAPSEFRVSIVLRSAGGLKPGDLLTPLGLMSDRLKKFDDAALVDGKRPLLAYDSALLFLTRAADGKRWRIVPGAMRLRCPDGRVFAPDAHSGLPLIRKGVRWPVLVTRIRDDLDAVRQFQTAQRLTRPDRRSRALLDWIASRRAEFSAHPCGDDETPLGWGRLQQEVFDSLLHHADLSFAWEVSRLYADLNQGRAVQSRLFETPAATAFLLEKMENSALSLGERTRALELLQPADLKDDARKKLIARLVELLRKEYLLQAAIARKLFSLGKVGDLNDVIIPLKSAYRTSKTGEARDELALALHKLFPVDAWKELSGNASGVVAVMRDIERSRSEIAFFLQVRLGSEIVYEPPVLLMEKLGTLNFVAETKRIDLTFDNFEGPWAAGWKASFLLSARANLAALAPSSTYRFRIEGYTGKGKDRQKWLSEPYLLTTPAKMSPDDPFPQFKR